MEKNIREMWEEYFREFPEMAYAICTTSVHLKDEVPDAVYEGIRKCLAARGDIWNTSYGYADPGENGENLGVYILPPDTIVIDLDNCMGCCEEGCYEWCRDVKAAHEAFEQYSDKICAAIDEFLEEFYGTEE